MTKKKIEKIEEILLSAYVLTNQVQELEKMDPIATSETVKQVLQYFGEKLEFKNRFTIA